MWDPDSQHFVVRDQILMLEIGDFYFLMGLSYWGAMIVLAGKKGGLELVDSYIRGYCHLHT